MTPRRRSCCREGASGGRDVPSALANRGREGASVPCHRVDAVFRDWLAEDPPVLVPQKADLEALVVPHGDVLEPAGDALDAGQQLAAPTAGHPKSTHQ